jgi:hypothetical protein
VSVTAVVGIDTNNLHVGFSNDDSVVEFSDERPVFETILMNDIIDYLAYESDNEF